MTADADSAAESAAEGKTAGTPLLWRWAPLIVLAIAAAAFFASGLHEAFTLDALRRNRDALVAWVEANAVLAALEYIAVYAAAIVFLPPSGAIMTVTGGFVFGAALGTTYAVIGATIGATLLFLVARLSIGDVLRRRAGPAIRKMEAGFRDNALSYLLVLRLVPLFPFWLVNLAPAFLGVPLRTFVIGTAIGIIPGTAVFAIFGSGLGSVLDRNEEISLSGVITPQIMAGLGGLAVLALVPVVYKRFKRPG
ncbi:MAG: TVP38/TMEM64 family protein [Rhodospirillales bacterium]|nr:TVP38/TMEM64 family protein [Rhodospirillales bacterium]